MPLSKRYQVLQSELLTWYHAHARDLPWRQTTDPYAIWISEIMLQQTQVKTVIPYFKRFMERFPDVYVLAKARQDTVLKLWEGLGYYSRARNVHAAAKMIVTDFNRQIPDRPEDLRRLPGIGQYSAGAIASIAFGLDEPVLDGNVIRVLCRIDRIHNNPKQADILDRLWKTVRKLIPPGKAGAFNQALMELGAMVCTPKSPMCLRCPVLKVCQAYKYGEQAQLPLKSAKKKLPFYHIAVGIIYKNGRILIGRRKPEGLLGGLWEFPGGKQEKGETLEQAVVREVREEVGIDVNVRARVTSVNHAYSHFKIRLHAFECVYMAGRARAIGCEKVKWIWPSQLTNYAFPAANKKVFEQLNVYKHKK